MVAWNDWRADAHLRSVNGEDCCRRIACEAEVYETLNVSDRVDLRSFYEEVENVNGIGERKASERIDGGGPFGDPCHTGSHEVGESMVRDYRTETWNKIHPGVSLFLSPVRSPQYDDASAFLHDPLLDPASCSSSCPSCPSLCATLFLFSSAVP